jgi:23S rRNA (uracil1939-C5)-methyltransferase
MSKVPLVHTNVRIEKLVHGGQAMGTLDEGRKVFVWNALPGELANVEVFKSKKDYAEGYATEIIEKSSDRTDFLERKDINLSVAPWTIMSYKAELEAKKVILAETFAREGIKVVDVEDIVGSASGRADHARIHSAHGSMRNPEGVSYIAYRNKIEFSFWGDDEGLHFAHYLRATHMKIKLAYPYSTLIPDEIADYADKLLSELNQLQVRAGDIKSVIIRCSQGSATVPKKVVAALFVKTEDFKKLKCDNLAVVYSNPKSPASVRTNDIYTNGDITLTDKLLGKNITYDVFSFFQVNIPIFQRALKRIELFSGSMPTVDMYSGVGSIGIPLGRTQVLVEADEENVRMAKLNVGNLPIKVVHTTSENALEYIDDAHALIVDPPRAGLHTAVVDRILDVEPPQVIYLSCNPSTQARDVKKLLQKYKIRAIEGFNFFPRTPHIESLVVLEKL